MHSTHPDYPATPQIPVTNTLHGTEIIDSYQWLEDADTPEVKEWTSAQNNFTHEFLNSLPQREWLSNYFEKLWRYDDSTVPRKVLNSNRVFFKTKKADQEKWVYETKENPDAPAVVLLDPNTWEKDESLDFCAPSRDGKWLAYGIAEGGNEDPRIHIMNVETKEILPDTCRGWKQAGISWMPDNSGFFYASKPLKGTVPEKEEYFWHTVWFHTLNTPAEKDKKIFWSDDVREKWHGAHVTEDGKYILLYRGLFNQTDVFIAPLDSPEQYVPVVTNIDARFAVSCVADSLYIRTDMNAPNEIVYVTDTAHPGQEHWKVFLPEAEEKLLEFSPINGYFFASYLHNAHSVIKIYTKDGTYVRDLPLPEPGSAGVSGYWSQPPVYLGFSSYTYMPTTYEYNIEKNTRKVIHTAPYDIEMPPCTVTQVWYPSKDGTNISMFIVHKKDIKKDSDNPTLLTGYGGFNIPMTPGFATTYATWIIQGGVLAIPNLRGGGEYGEKWHEAGMRENKQNVFDDFIAAAEYLIENKYTSPKRLVCRGGSNGGLLMGAITVQRPDLFSGIICNVPLLDMIRYHLFGIADIWSEEYGTAEQPDEFAWLYAYSPYHHVKNGVTYPAVLFIGSENDARTDPLHARKMGARMQALDDNDNPIYILIRSASGHGGGVTLSKAVAQNADIWAFLMHFAGMHPESVSE